MIDFVALMGEGLQGLGKDVDVRECPDDKPIIAGRPNPFDNHLYGTFVIVDGDQSLSAEMIVNQFVVPMRDSMNKTLRRFNSIEVQPLPYPKVVNPENGKVMPDGTIKELLWVDGIPVRVVLMYDVRLAGTRVTFDLLARHVGDHYRMIINGPLHRHMMPLSDEQVKLEQFNYYYMPLDRPNYYVTDAYDDDAQLLPGLDRDELYRDTMHLYRLKGDYCYYRGESYL